MHQVDIGSIDLNLLKLFDALMRERSVTRAGLRLGLSQPAASRALARLRLMFADRLVVRGRHGLELTPRGEQLAGPVSRLLEDARSIISPATFEPAMATGQVRIAAHDHLGLLMLSGLMARLERQAPGLAVHVEPPAGDNIQLVEQGQVDVALGVYETLPGSLHQRILYQDRLVCMLGSRHAASMGHLTLSQYTAMRHVVVTISGMGESAVDIALSNLGRTRHIALRIPHFLAAAMMVVDNGMLLTLPGRLAHLLAKSLPLAVLELPLQVAPLSPSMIWHERFQGDPAHGWLRQQLVEVAGSLATGTKLPRKA
ncbi:LysR family transcriptional regulator [Pseudomonas aeruginosa]|uniref:LysR family transcriptional regulator n=1 Tax=Pseudomonas aeruginosa TaxID=287 RepID=UPI00229F30B5|nr:LysR family transcriptional regulator [Pseudomonas aeruginosa]HBO0862180.1 LysR family transcriptional regulator [Pseudomonas aeruginosa]HBO5213034.1 LysR family transcriptional regulator [Pseudomonas aeruginosa]HCE6879231.1 LysR family transcriptional regulator [Pseudomonas aeruginosa]HCE9345499.1 LysR family transcriptional regulator [Pseudomonas aeruginosa]